MIVEGVITALVKVTAPPIAAAFLWLAAGGAFLQILVPLPGLACLGYLAVMIVRREERARVEGHH